jgi:hypothetical protein
MGQAVMAVIGIVLFVLGVSATILGGIVQITMVDEVNKARPITEKPMSYLWWTPPKCFTLASEYKKFYPNGKLLAYEKLCLLAQFGGIFSGAIILAFAFRAP